MTTHAITSSAVHATLEDLGYQSCDKHGKVYWWLGDVPCPRCKPAGKRRPIRESLVKDRPPKVERPRGICDHYLSTGNPGPLCRPCVVTWRKNYPDKELPKRKEDLQRARDENELRRERYAQRKLKQGHTVAPRDRRVKLPNLWTHLNKASLRGLSRDAIAEKIGISTNSLYGYAQPNTTRTCALDKAESLADLLEVPLEELRRDSTVDDSLTRQYHLYCYLPNLNSIRKAQGLTWSDLEEIVGLSLSSLKDYVNQHRCSPEKAKKIADVLGVSLEELKGEG